MENRAVFLDRDGTLNIDPGYLKSPELVRLFPDVPASLAQLKNELGFKLIVVSNQSGIGKGLLTHQDVASVNRKINELLGNNSSIDAFYYCPHHPETFLSDSCACRKPSPQMLLEAGKKFKINFRASYMIGDMATDIGAGKNAGVKTILVETGMGQVSRRSLQEKKLSPDHIAKNMADAVQFIRKDLDEIQ